MSLANKKFYFILSSLNDSKNFVPDKKMPFALQIKCLRRNEDAGGIFSWYQK